MADDTERTLRKVLLVVVAETTAYKNDIPQVEKVRLECETLSSYTAAQTVNTVAV